MIARLAAAMIAVAGAAGAGAQERVWFSSNDSDLTRGAPTELAGFLWRPAGAPPFPAIVLMHGCGGLYLPSGRITARHREWAERFRDLGYVAFHVDSFSTRGYADLCRSNPQPVRPGIERARDAYGALAFLQARSDIRADRIGLLGWSHGGSTTLWTLRDGSPARPSGLRADFAAAVAFYPGCASPLAWSGNWTTRIPLLVLSGEADDWTPVEPCRALIARTSSWGAPVAIVTYPEAHHGFDAPNQRLLVLRRVNTPSGTATIGTDQAARMDSIERVTTFFAARLR